MDICFFAEYKSPEYETLAFDMIIKRLIENGYPEVSNINFIIFCSWLLKLCFFLWLQELSQLEYDASFPLRYNLLLVV